MNLGLTTSFLIGGILLVAILSMNMSLSNSSTELTLTQISREKAAGVQEIISHDIQKIGYNRNDKTSPIWSIADSNKIQFYSNIDNSYDNSVELVTWEFTNTSLNNTQNPNDYVLKRTIKNLDTGAEEITPIRLGVTNFNVKYINEYGKDVSSHMSAPVTGSDMQNIRQLYIKLELQSAEKVFQGSGGNGRYIRSIWEKRFSPGNLESN